MSKKCILCRKEMDGETLKEDTSYYEEKKYDVENDDIGICQPCAREQRIVERAKEIRESLESFMRSVNSTAFNRENIEAEALVRAFTTEHRYLQNELLVFFYNVFGLIGKLPDGYTDARNEWGYRWARLSSNVLETNEMLEQISRMTEYENPSCDAESTLNRLIEQVRRGLKKPE